MVQSYLHIILALFYCKGERVQAWVDTQMVVLDANANRHGKDIEKLWESFYHDFEGAFVSTTQQQNAYARLKNLHMEKDDLDGYITTHSTLVTRTGWKLNGDAAIETFREGLIKSLHLVILNRDKLLDTLDRWQKAARREHAKYTLKKATNLLRGGKKALQKLLTKKPRKHEQDPDAMDVDNTRLSPLTEQERERLMKEG
jgi:retrotransposon gag protein